MRSPRKVGWCFLKGKISRQLRKKLCSRNPTRPGATAAFVEVLHSIQYDKMIFDVQAPSTKRKRSVYILPFKKYHPTLGR
jgi:hypothetical protein